MRPKANAVPAVATALLLAGCFGGLKGDDAAAGIDPSCVHPFPCETPAALWPPSLQGPFELGLHEQVRIPSDDGTELVGGLWLPDLPDGVKAPTILWQSPYFGACVVHNGPSTSVNPENPAGYTPFPCQPPADSMELYDMYGRIHIRTLVEAGYAVASMNVRGTGNSGGCNDPFGTRESEDSAWLVEHLAAQDWSNGRVAMVGHSYSGGTPWGAAVRDPPHLKAIVASGLVTDLYTFYHTPQGLASDLHASLLTTLMYENTLPTNPESGDQVTWPGSQRQCPNYGLDPAYDIPQRALTERDEAFWEAHRYVTGFHNITAAVLVSHGYYEGCPFGHCQQDDVIWDLIDAPKRFILGRWGHDLPPPPEQLENAPFGARWYEDTMVPWLDYWLKGIGKEPDLGVVDWQDQDDGWHRADHPQAAHEEVVYLAGPNLVPSPQANPPRSLVSSAAVDACMAGLTYSVQATEPLLLRGSPLLFLDLQSSTPRGQFYAYLATSDEPLFGSLGEGGCPAYATHGGGAVDLRYHAGGYSPADFPVSLPTHVRVDLGSVGLSVEAGHWISLVLVNDGLAPTADGAALLTVRSDGGERASQLVLPLAEGTLGGLPPAVAYPQRPFAPEPGPFVFAG